MSCISGKRKERRRGKNKNGKYHDRKSSTQCTEQFQSKKKVRYKIMYIYEENVFVDHAWEKKNSG